MARALGIAGSFFLLASPDGLAELVWAFLTSASRLAATAEAPIGEAFANENDVLPTVGEASAAAFDTSSFFAGEKSNAEGFFSVDVAFTAVGVLVPAAGDDS